MVALLLIPDRPSDAVIAALAGMVATLESHYVPWERAAMYFLIAVIALSSASIVGAILSQNRNEHGHKK